MKHERNTGGGMSLMGWSDAAVRDGWRLFLLALVVVGLWGFVLVLAIISGWKGIDDE